MKLFGKQDSAKLSSFPSEEEILEESEKAAEDILHNLASEASEELAFLNKEHREDSSTYFFSAEKFGDFLALKIKRRGIFYAGAINVKEADSIELKIGSPIETKKVHCEGYSHWNYSQQAFGHAYINDPPTRQKSDVLTVVQAVLERNSPNTFMFYGNIHVKPWRSRKSIEFPSPPKDDYIWFHKAKATICVPHGLGETVYLNILRALNYTSNDRLYFCE